VRWFRFISKLGWPLVILAVGLPLVRWATIVPLDVRFASPVQTLLSLGQITGIIGLILYAINLILSTRLRIFEDLFGGLNRVYIVHHILGGVALIALMLHPLLLALRLAPSSLRTAALFLIPQLDNLPVAYGIVALAGMIGLLYLTFFVTLPYRLWLATHKFLGAFFFFGGAHVLLVPSRLYNDNVLGYYMLVFIALGCLAFLYRTVLPRVFIRRYGYIVRSATPLAKGVIQIDMVPARRAMNFKAGQFIFVSFRQKGISTEWHPFTVSSAPRDAALSITMKSLGSYTKFLNQMQGGLAGSHVWVEGAYGRFSFRNFKSNRQVWIAGGIGITPFLSMARDLGSTACAIDLYYAVRTEAELVDLALLQQVSVAGSMQSLRVIPFISEKQGHLTADYINLTSGGLVDKDILVCGPPMMTKTLKEQLRALGVKKRQIHSEEFSMS
jgi:predicted ferric reductase